MTTAPQRAHALSLENCIEQRACQIGTHAGVSVRGSRSSLLPKRGASLRYLYSWGPHKTSRRTYACDTSSLGNTVPTCACCALLLALAWNVLLLDEPTTKRMRYLENWGVWKEGGREHRRDNTTDNLSSRSRSDHVYACTHTAFSCLSPPKSSTS